MAKAKMEIRQFESGNKTYIFHRYKDDKNKNYEYQVYQLVNSITAAKNLGAPERIPGRESKLNSREMCDWVFDKL